MESLSTRQQIIVKMAGALVSNSSIKIEKDFYPKTIVLDAIELTDDHKEFIRNNCVAGFSSLRLAQLAFKDETIKSLSIHHRAVNDYVKEWEEIKNDEACETFEEAPRSYTKRLYKPPDSEEEIVKKIVEATHEEVELEKLNHEEINVLKGVIVLNVEKLSHIEVDLAATTTTTTRRMGTRCSTLIYGERSAKSSRRRRDVVPAA